MCVWLLVVMERVSWKPSNMEISPNCPRCGSSNTKFCYYNNYSLTQPRYFCKGCRRYWTKGGSLRNVPVGGGCRKNRRPNHNNNNNNKPPPGRLLLDADRGDHDGLSSSTTSSGGNSHIDLALVYANFLNQDSSDVTRNSTGVLDQIPAPDLAGDFLLPNISSMHLDSSGVHDQDHGLVAAACFTAPSDQPVPETQLAGGDQLAYFSELDSIHHQQLISGCSNNFGLPPFPGEEVGSDDHDRHHQEQECLWSASSSSSSMIHALHSSTTSTQLLGLESEAHDQEPNLVSGHVSWSPFDLSTYDHFSRP